MNPNSSQFPDALKGFVSNKAQLPDAQGFSDAALSGHKKTKVSSSVKVIEPRGGIVSPISKESYNEASTALTNMRKSGEAAKYDASVVEGKNASKKLIKIDSGKAK